MALLTNLSRSLRGVIKTFFPHEAARELAQVLDDVKGITDPNATERRPGYFTTIDVSSNILLTNETLSQIIASGPTKLLLPQAAGITFDIQDDAGNQYIRVTAIAGAEQVMIGAGGATVETFRVRWPATFEGGFTSTTALVTSAGVGTVAGTGIAVSELGDGVLHKTVFTLTNHPITITDSAGNGGHGTTAFYTFPEGHIRILGAHMNLTWATSGTPGVAADGQLDIGVGQAAVGVDNEELATTEADILLIDDNDLSSSAGSGNASMAAANVLIDGSATAGTLNFNAAAEDLDMTSNDVLTVNGTITILWAYEGDD